MAEFGRPGFMIPRHLATGYGTDVTCHGSGTPPVLQSPFRTPDRFPKSCPNYVFFRIDAIHA